MLNIFILLLFIFKISSSSELRVVSLAPSITEILFGLGLTQHQIIGISNYCNYPEDKVNKVRFRVGGYINPSLESILMCHPNLVIASEGTPKDIVVHLRRLNIRVINYAPKNIRDILEGIKEIGKLTGREREAKLLVKDFKRRLNRIIKEQSKIKYKCKVYLELSQKPIISVGKNSFLNQIIHFAGGKNIFGGINTPYPIVSIEEILVANPDVIIMAPHKEAVKEVLLEELKSRPGFNNITAIKRNRVYIVDPDIFMRPSLRSINAIEQLFSILYKDVVHLHR